MQVKPLLPGDLVRCVYDSGMTPMPGDVRDGNLVMHMVGVGDASTVVAVYVPTEQDVASGRFSGNNGAPDVMVLTSSGKLGWTCSTAHKLVGE